MPQMIAGDLDIAFERHGPQWGRPVLLLHGWPDSLATWDAVVPALAGAGYQVIVPGLRGFGDTRFVSPATPRTADSAILALDQIALMDALGIDRFSVVGHDWGANIAEALAVGWPERVERIAMLSTPPRLGGVPTPPFAQAQRQWYHWFMATERGAAAVRADPHGFARIMWENWSPTGWFDEASFRRAARAFDAPDWVDVTLHSYRARWDEAEPDPRGLWLDRKIRAAATLALPAIYVQGEVDGVNPPEASAHVAEKFSGPFHLIQLAGVGHFPQRERPDEIAHILLGFLADDPAARPGHAPGDARTRRTIAIAAATAAGIGIGGAALIATRRRAPATPPEPDDGAEESGMEPASPETPEAPTPTP